MIFIKLNQNNTASRIIEKAQYLADSLVKFLTLRPRAYFSMPCEHVRSKGSTRGAVAPISITLFDTLCSDSQDKLGRGRQNEESDTRTNTLIRSQPTSLNSVDCFVQSTLILDKTALCLRAHRKILTLSYPEMKMLCSLATIENHTLSRDQMAVVLEWNIDVYERHALEKFVSRLKYKIKKCFDLTALESVRGFGYKLSVNILIEYTTP